MSIPVSLLMTLATLLFASAFMAMAALQAGTLRILLSQSEASAGAWADYVASVAFLQTL